VSADGGTIVGSSFNPDVGEEAWIATVPEPPGAALGVAATAVLAVLAAERQRRSGGVCSAV
jgi:hypothetical protein